MKTSCKFLLILFLCPLFSWAQSNYRPGYVVTTKGDTVHGFINYHGWDANPTRINFKTALSNREDQTYTLNDITFFSVDGLAAYKKASINISMDETDVTRLVAGRDTSWRSDIVFLQVLQTGKNVALYSYRDALKLRLYLGETPSFTPLELEYRIYDYGGDTTHIIKGGTIAGNTVYENTYLKTLFALANKYDALDDKLNRTLQSASYKKEDILLIVSQINHISTDEYQKKYASHAKVNLYASAALNLSNSVQSAGSSPTAFSPTIALGVTLDPNPAAGKMELRADVALRLNSINQYGSSTTAYNETSISFTPQVLYNFYHADNLKIYLGLGFALINSTFSNKQGSGSVSESDNSFIFKAGLKVYNKFEVFFNYYTSSPTAIAGYSSYNNTPNQIGVSYFFGR